MIRRYFIGAAKGGKEFVYQAWNENPDIVEFEVDKMLGQHNMKEVTQEQYNAKRDQLINRVRIG